MISINLKPQKENIYCPLCFSIVTKASFDKHLDEKHPRNGYVAKKNLTIGNKQTLCLRNEKCLLYALQNL